MCDKVECVSVSKTHEHFADWYGGILTSILK